MIFANNVKRVEGLHVIEANGKDDSVKLVISDSSTVIFADSSDAFCGECLELVCDKVDIGLIESLCGVKVDEVISTLHH